LSCFNSYIIRNKAFQRSEPSFGAGIYIASGGNSYILNTVIADNVMDTTHLQHNGYGGGICNYGSLIARNSLIVRNKSYLYYSDSIYSGGSSVTTVLHNCTVVDGCGTGIRYGGGVISLTNCIVSGHTNDLIDFPTNQLGAVSNLYYSFIGNGDNAGTNGCITGDPLFVDNTYYHLQSVRGNYTNGYFSGGGWGVSESNCPCIDAGNPDSDFSLEPSPNGHKINMGAYGNTPKASLSKSAPMVIRVH
jgi:hypothetical protein